MIRRPPGSTRTDTLFPYTTLFRAEPLGIEVVVGHPESDLQPEAVFGVLLQHPGTTGVVRDLSPTIEAVHAAGGLAAVATDLLACTVIVPPGEQGADVVRPEERRVGKEGVRKCRSRWAPDH